MTYSLFNYLHVLGAILIGAGLIGVWLCDLRSRQNRDLKLFAESVRNIAVFYDGVVVPGAILLLISGTWMVVDLFPGWSFLQSPWLAGMILLFLLEFIEGNTITRLYFMRLRKMTEEALKTGVISAELEAERGKTLPSFTHYLDLPMLFLIVALGSLKPATWTLFFIGSFLAIALATALTIFIPKLYPWGAPK